MAQGDRRAGAGVPLRLTPVAADRGPLETDATATPTSRLIGMGRIVTEFLERRRPARRHPLLQRLVRGAGDDRRRRHGPRRQACVLVSCETDRQLPARPRRLIAAWLSAKLPGGYGVMRFARLLQPQLRQLPFVFGQMSKRGVPDELMRRLAGAAEARRRSAATLRQLRRRRRCHGKHELRAASADAAHPSRSRSSSSGTRRGR